MTAAKYADKAVALLYWLSTDYQSSGRTSGWRFLGRGDGTATTFTLPDTPITGTFQVSKVPVSTQTVIRGSTANSQDQLSTDIYWFIKVSDTPDGAATYLTNTDWIQNSNYRNDFIDWSPLGSEPAAGATYYVTVADLSNTLALGSGYTQSGTTLTFTVAPTTAEAVVVNYMYSSGGISYRQTSNGMGGLNNIFIDSSFTARFLFYAVLAYDWVYEYSGFPQSLKATLEGFFIQWDAWTKGYSLNAMTPTQPANTNLPYKPNGLEGLQSNYEAGYYAMRCAIAAALDSRNSGGPQIVSDIVAYRSSYLTRDIRATPGTNTYSSFLGGWDVEGWGDYAPRATSLVLIGSQILNEHGAVADMSAEQAWAGEIIRCYLHGQPTPSWAYMGGDFGEYPPPVDKDWMKPKVAMASDLQAAQEGAHYLVHGTASSTNDAFDLLYHDPNATTLDWTTTEPLWYYASGSGLVLSRADWSYSSTWCSFELGDLAISGHNTFSCGTVFVNRGADDLLVTATEAASSENVVAKLANGNVVLIGSTQDTQNVGPNHTLIKAQEGTSAYTLAEGDYHNAYTSPKPTELFRVFFHVRPDYIFIYDRVTTTLSATVKQLQWYGNAAAAMSRTGDTWTVTHGSSKLFGMTYSSTAITSANDTPTVAGTNPVRVTVNPTSAVSSIRYATVLQTAAATTANMDASAFITAGSAFEGILIGQVLSLFGTTFTGSGPTGYAQSTSGGVSYTYTAPGGTVTHYIVDLIPSHVYTLSGAASGNITASTAGVATFTTSGTGSQTVTIT